MLRSTISMTAGSMSAAVNRGASRRGASGTRRTRRRGRARRGASAASPRWPAPPSARQRARAPRRGRLGRGRPKPRGRRRGGAPDVRHCQSCEREISAVAASSIRLLIAAAPLPPSHASRYWSATVTFSRTPASVIVPPSTREVQQLGGRSTATSSRSRSFWFGRSPRTPSKISVASGTRSGWATHVPSKPSPDSRSLSSRTLAIAVALTSASRRLGMNAAMPPIACAPRRWHVRDEQLRVGPHERRRSSSAGRDPAATRSRPGRGTS